MFTSTARVLLRLGAEPEFWFPANLYIQSPCSSAQLFHEVRGCAKFPIEGLPGDLKPLGEEIDDVRDLLRGRLPHSWDGDFRGRSLSSI
jgi:hypothetical protein